MTNGRRRPARDVPARGGPARRGGPAPRRPAPGRRAPAGRNGAYDAPVSGLGGLHPALLAGLIIVPILLLVVVVMALMSGGNKPPIVPDGEMNAPNLAAPIPPPLVDQPGTAPRDYTRPLTQAEKDMLERSWAPLRARAAEHSRIAKEGIEFWKQEDPVQMQKKFHEANRIWREIRDKAQGLLTQFSDDQVEKYLGQYEIELINWGKTFKTYSKLLDISE